MKKILALLFFITISVHAQYKITGQLKPAEKYNWVILYKIEGARQNFVKSGSVKKVSKVIDGKNVSVGQFEFDFSKENKPGTYRVTYNVEKNGYVDFIFNNENVTFLFDPNNAEESISFSESTENKLYKEYTTLVTSEQFKTDSLQVDYLKNQQKVTAELYKVQLAKIAALQKVYLDKSNYKMAKSFIKATNRYNSPIIIVKPKDYLKSVVNHFFDNIDFNNETLYNSTFLVDRITDYVFYMNHSDDVKTQITLHKKAVKTVLLKATNPIFKRDLIEFLITQFTTQNNIELADHLLNSYYKKLPLSNQNIEFTQNYLEQTEVSIGRIAPEIVWKENGKNYKLSTINEAQNYVLIFWSTGCSHCLREIPKLHTVSKNKKNTKVIAFSLENNDRDWKTWKKKLPGWHHIIGLNKWENLIARQYQINSTPTYIILDNAKKIIAKPETLDEVKKIIEYLE
jgi:thiol-disulfide isomerase/thioredoxin